MSTYNVPSTMWITVHKLALLILNTTLWGRFNYYPHFTNEETEHRKIQTHPSSKVQTQAFKSSPSAISGSCYSMKLNLTRIIPELHMGPASVDKQVGHLPENWKVAGSNPKCHKPGLQVRSPIRVHMRGNWSIFLSHMDDSLPLFLPPFPFL